MDDMQDLNDDISDINEAGSRATVTPTDNCSIQFSLDKHRFMANRTKDNKGTNETL